MTFASAPPIGWRRLNPLLSEAGFSTAVASAMEVLRRGGLNPLLSEAGFSTVFFCLVFQ